VERITADPILAQSKLIAEPWDAAGLYQIGAFGRLGRWAEWNDHFRDDIRRFVKGDPGMVPRLASRLAGSPDIFGQQHGSPYCSINFVTCHDGFTLADLVTYNYKHNETNGEHGRDGPHDNHSWNCGEEGPTTTPEVCGLRRRQMKNMMTLLFLAQGVPMLLGGDEMGRTQQGTNNAYCHDSFVALLIRFRKRHAVLRQPRFLTNDTAHLPALIWHGCHLGQPDWSWESRALAVHLLGGKTDSDIYIIANAYWEPQTFALPQISAAKHWYRSIDTMHESPADISPPGEELLLATPYGYQAGPRSVAVLVGK
jgi:glycogen operon protein